MTGRVLPGQARTSRSMTVYDFNRCDVVLPWPWVFSGGGSRLRRNPAGDFVAVAAGNPRLDYAVGGAGKGVKVFAEATNNVSHSGDLSAWTDYVTGPATVHTQMLWDAEIGPYVRCTKTAGDVGYRAGKSMTFSAASGVGLCAGAKVRFNGVGAYGFAPFAQAHNGTEWVTASVYHVAPPLGVWLDAAGSASGDTLAAGGTFYAWNEGPAGTSIDFALPHCNTGTRLHEYVETAGTAYASPAESISCTDLAALGLDGDEWTVIVEAQEPASVPASYPTLFVAIATAGNVNINKQPGGTVSYELYDGTTWRPIQIAGRPVGTVRRYAFGYGRSQGVMRVGATGEVVQTLQHAQLAAAPALSTVYLGGATYDKLDSIIASVRVASRLLSEAEITQELKL